MTNWAAHKGQHATYIGTLGNTAIPVRIMATFTVGVRCRFRDGSTEIIHPNDLRL